MAFDRAGGGHYFDLITEKCVKCDMTREHYQDRGQPQCTGKMPESRAPMTVPQE
jgi:hypothetical protein